MLLAEGLENAIRRHALLAEATRARGVQVGRGAGAGLQHPNPAERANSITCILMQGRDPQPLLDYCRDKCGVVLGVGLGELAGKAFRIAHMGHTNAPMVLGTLGAVEMGLQALRHPARGRRRAGRGGRTWGARWRREFPVGNNCRSTGNVPDREHFVSIGKFGYAVSRSGTFQNPRFQRRNVPDREHSS